MIWWGSNVPGSHGRGVCECVFECLVEVCVCASQLMGHIIGLWGEDSTHSLFERVYSPAEDSEPPHLCSGTPLEWSTWRAWD